MLNPLVFDKILTHKNSNYCIVANTYLHILSTAYPDFLKNYSPSKKGRLRMVLRFKLIFIIRILQSIFNKKCNYMGQEAPRSKVLFISHLVSSQKMLQDSDAYFGDLPSQLLKHGVGSSIALINHTKVNDRHTSKFFKNSRITRFILSPNLDFFSEIKLYLEQRASKKQLKLILRDLKINKILEKDILDHHLSSDTLSALRIAKQVADIVNKTGVKFIITTYEGHAWERLVYYYAREANPGIKCFGYQHSAVFEYQHSIKRQLGSKYNPDVILTAGVFSQGIFNQLQSINSKIICLGSPKHLTIDLTQNTEQCCLVVPQGEVIECLSLFEFSLTYAKQHQSQKIIWRLHPLLSFSKLKKHSAIFKNIPNNIHLSEGSLDDDVKKCDSVLYRGSTAVINAINAGLKPIYYQHTADELSIDPIYTHKEGKSIVRNQKELGLALNKDINIKTKQSLRNFAQDFYTPLDVGILLKEMEI